MTRREVNRFLVAGGVAVLIAVLATRVLLPDPNPPIAAAAAIPASAVQGGMSAELLGELATGYECRQAARAFVQPAKAERDSWSYHATAHHLGMTGQISKEEMQQRWKKSLGNQKVQDPVFQQAWGAMVAACGQATTAGATAGAADHGGHQP